MPTVIHVSPHPDDESIAATCTLLALQRHGWRVINYAVTLGRANDRKRREHELAQALSHTRLGDNPGFIHRTPDPPIGISRRDDLHRAARRLTDELQALVEAERADLIVGPHPRDGHHGHVAVARAIRETVWSATRPPVWWMWSIWQELTRPTLIASCDPRDLAISKIMLKEYEGENQRSDYLTGVENVRKANAVFGIEKALGWGSAPHVRLSKITQAELLTEVWVRRRLVHGLAKREWVIGRPRVLDAAKPLIGRWNDLDDHTILSPARFRRLVRPGVVSLLSQHVGWQKVMRSSAEPQVVPDLADRHR